MSFFGFLRLVHASFERKEKEKHGNFFSKGKLQRVEMSKVFIFGFF